MFQKKSPESFFFRKFEGSFLKIIKIQEVIFVIRVQIFKWESKVTYLVNCGTVTFRFIKKIERGNQEDFGKLQE